MTRPSKDHLYYLGAPFSHPDAEVRAERLRLVNQFAAQQMRAGFKIYSPLTHNVPLMQTGHLPQGFAFWQVMDGEMFRRCDALMLFKLPGWQVSTGVAQEFKWAQEQNKPIVSYTASGRLARHEPQIRRKLSMGGTR